jgi:hypothetical protein
MHPLLAGFMQDWRNETPYGQPTDWLFASSRLKGKQPRSLILFAGWSTLAHDGVMIVQGIQYHDLRSDLLGFAIIALIGLALIALTPAKQGRASVVRA